MFDCIRPVCVESLKNVPFGIAGKLSSAQRQRERAEQPTARDAPIYGRWAMGWMEARLPDCAFAIARGTSPTGATPTRATAFETWCEFGVVCHLDVLHRGARVPHDMHSQHAMSLSPLSNPFSRWRRSIAIHGSPVG